ncbi:MAG: PAS domain S-box protein [Bacteroidales bacterium]|nr:PAS domain S-box protein [Bacteroidales bacterium]
MKNQEDLFSATDHVTGGRINEVASPGVINLEIDGRVLQCSECLDEWFGAEGSFRTGVSLFEVHGNEWIQQVIVKRTVGANYEGLLYSSMSVEAVPVSMQWSILKGNAKSKDSVILMFERKSEIKSLQTEDKWEAEKLRIIFENISDIVSLHSLRGDFLYITPSVQRLNGYTPEEMMDLGGFHAIHPQDVHLIQDFLGKLSDHQEPIKLQYKLIHKDGHIIWVESISQVIKDENGKPALISVVTRDITVSHLLEENVKASEEKYRILVKNLPTGLILINIKGEILEVNQAMLDILGSPGEEPTRMINLFEFENIIKAGITEDLSKCITDGKVIVGQAEYISKWGKKSHLYYSLVPLFDSSSAVNQVLCNVRDVTRIKRAEEKSHQQIDFLNVVINTMQEPFFVKDENHKWIMLNDAAVGMMGYPRESLLGKSDYDLYPREQADIFWAKDNWVFENGSNVNEETITWKDGSERVIITYKHLYTETSTGKRYIVGTIHDITDLKLSENLLRESENKYHELFDNAIDYVFTTDLEGRFTNANKTMLQRLNTTVENISSYCIYDFCKPEILEEARMLKAHLIEDGSIEPFEIETPEREGKVSILEVQARLIYNNGKATGIQGIARDVSEKKLASQKLEQMNRELQELNASKDKFYSIIAHDLKNPFNSLIGFSELLLEDFDVLSKDEMRDYVGIIRNTAKNSLILLENLLAWSRLQTGRMVYNPVKLALSSEIDAAVTVLFSLSYKKKIEVDNEVEKSVLVKADQNMLLSVLHNLLMNAIKFTPSNGRIWITCSQGIDENTGPYALVSVNDNGTGISKDNMAKLFSLTKPFTMPGTDKETGTGLGLLLTREMVEKHGGALFIESEPGKGSSFSFRIPLFVP